MEIVLQIWKETAPLTVQWCFSCSERDFPEEELKLTGTWNLYAVHKIQKKTISKSQFAIQILDLAVMHLCSTSVKFSSGSISCGNDIKDPLWDYFAMGAFSFSLPLKQTCSHFQNSSEEPVSKKGFPLPGANLVLLKLSSSVPNSLNTCNGCIPLQCQLQTAPAGDAIQLLAQKGDFTCQ